MTGNSRKDTKPPLLKSSLPSLKYLAVRKLRPQVLSKGGSFKLAFRQKLNEKILSFCDSHGGHSAVKANLGANEGYIFLLEKSMLYISKLPLFLLYSDISEIRFERVSGALTSSARTFDLIVHTKTGRNEHTFSAVSKEEQSVMEDFLKRDKKLKVKNVLEENVNAVNSAIAEALMDDGDSDDDDKPRRAGDEDEDSEVDEDFKAESGDDDVEEEFNEVSHSTLHACFSLTDRISTVGRTTREVLLVTVGQMMQVMTMRTRTRMLGVRWTKIHLPKPCHQKRRRQMILPKCQRKRSRKRMLKCGRWRLAELI